MAPKRSGTARTEFIEQGAFDVWITGWELAAAWGEIDLDAIEGFLWVPTDRAINPFRNYVDELFRLKQNAPKNDPRREMYKLLLNSLYGKTVQRRRERPNWVAGGLFNAFWGSQITGHCRARLHQLEHEYESLHSSTDSIMTRAAHIPEGTDLGQLQVEARGQLIVARSKLYVVLDQHGAITKKALHAFRGTPEQFLTVLRTGTPTYTVKHMVRPRESLRTGQKPFQMVERTYSLHLPTDVLRRIRQQLEAI